MAISWTPSEEDFAAVLSWGHIEDPFAAVKDFSFTKLDRRWLNPEQNKAYDDYVAARNGYIQDKDFDNYYRNAQKPIDKLRWDYLKIRKSWFQMPLGWDRIARAGGIVYDLGCGDGDTSQLLIDFLSKYWEKHSIDDVEVQIRGFDLNASRIDNARNHVSSPTERIKFSFDVADLYEPLTSSTANFALICGVIEILDQEKLESFTSQVCSKVTDGIYIEDLFEQFPGGYPNDKLGKLFQRHGYQTIEREVVMTEPFNEKHLMDPMRIWPNHIDQNLWLEPLFAAK